MADRSRSDKAVAEASRILIDYNPILESMRAVVKKSVKFHEDLWDEDAKKRADFRQYLVDHPDEARQRFASSIYWLNKAIPTKINHEVNDNSDRKRLKPEDLAKMGLSLKQIKRLAGLDNGGEDVEDAKIVEDE